MLKENDAFKWAVILFFLTLLIVAMYFSKGVYADCLDSEQIETVELLCNKMNLSLNETLLMVDLFESLCEQNSTYNVTQNITQNITYEYNDSMLMNNISLLLNMSEDLEESLDSINDSLKFFWNNTTVATELEHIYDKMTTREVIDEWNDTMVSKRAEVSDDLEEVFDEKLVYFKDSYVRKEDWNSTVEKMWITIRNIPQEGDWYAKMAFWGVIIIGGIVLAFHFVKTVRPKSFKKIKIKEKEYPIDEETSESDIMRKTERIRNLKFEVVKNKDLSIDEKNGLIKKIDTNEVWDDDSLEKEVELIMSLKKADKKQKKRVKK